MPSFDLLFQQYFEPLTRQVARIVESEHVAEELVQDVFFRMWSGRDEIDVRGDLVNYLRRAARNRALDWLRHENLHREWEESAALESLIFSQDSHGTEQDDIALVHQALEDCLTEMSDRRRLICELRWRDGLGPSAIAKRLSVSVKAVEAHLTQGNKDLRARLESVLLT